MLFLGCKALPKYPLLAYHASYFSLHYILVKKKKSWMEMNTYKQRKVLSLQAQIEGDTAQTYGSSVQMVQKLCLLFAELMSAVTSI